MEEENSSCGIRFVRGTKNAKDKFETRMASLHHDMKLKAAVEALDQIELDAHRDEKRRYLNKVAPLLETEGNQRRYIIQPAPLPDISTENKCLNSSVFHEQNTGTSTTREIGGMVTKQADHGSFVIPCSINSSVLIKSLADSGSSLNIIPLSLCRRLQLGPIKPLNIRVESLCGDWVGEAWILKNAKVRVDVIVFITDFIVLDTYEHEDSPIILGRPFLYTADATLHLGRQEISVGDGRRRVTFPVERRMNQVGITREKIFRIEQRDETLDNLRDLIDRSELNLLADMEEEQEEVVEEEPSEDVYQRLWHALEVHQFEQDWEEEIDEAWERMRDLMSRCPEGMISDDTCLTSFYNGLYVNAQKRLDEAAKGDFLAMTISDKYEMLFEKSYESYYKDPNKSALEEFEDDWQSTLLGSIILFKQDEIETLEESWDRMKELVEACTSQDFTKGTILRSFYIGLQEDKKEVLDRATDEGFLAKGDDEAYEFLEEKAYLKPIIDEHVKKQELIEKFEKFSMMFRSKGEEVVKILKDHYLEDQNRGTKRDWQESTSGDEEDQGASKKTSPNSRDTNPEDNTS